jgi:hypothetical protein
MCISSCPTSSTPNCKTCTYSADNFWLTYVQRGCLALKYSPLPVRMLNWNALHNLKCYKRNSTGQFPFQAQATCLPDVETTVTRCLVLRTPRLQQGAQWLRQEEWNFCGIKKHRTLYNRHYTEATERSHMDRRPPTSLSMLQFTFIRRPCIIPQPS